jgi:hypothetical protein
MTDMSPRHPGRPSKGDRLVEKMRLAPELKSAAEQAAKRKGMTANDYYAALVAADTGLTHLAPMSRQEVLPDAS